MFIEEKGNSIVATCGMQIIDYLLQCDDNGKLGYICNVYTIDKFRNLDIQTSLLNGCIEYAKENNIKELHYLLIVKRLLKYIIKSDFSKMI